MQGNANSYGNQHDFNNINKQGDNIDRNHSASQKRKNICGEYRGQYGINTGNRYRKGSISLGDIVITFEPVPLGQAPKRTMPAARAGDSPSSLATPKPTNGMIK